MNFVGHRATAAQQLSTYLRAHAAREDELRLNYEALSEALPSPSLRYVARLILEDEQRHQVIFGDLAETVFATDELKARGMPILQGSHEIDPMARQRAVAMLETLMTREDDERLELAALSSALVPSEESELWNLLLGLVAQDTRRHISWLAFMRDRML
jgi:hypothetical protein